MTRRFTDAFLTLPRLMSAGLEARDAEGPEAVRIDAAVTSLVPRPVAVYTPDGYEPNYAYPLVVWFHDAGEDERVLHRVMPQVTDRNALGLALRGERLRRGGGFDWPAGRQERRSAALLARFRDLRREYHVHTERVVLVGRGTGAGTAAELFFAKPEWFGGLALLDPPSESLSIGLTATDGLDGKPVLLDLPTTQLGRGRDTASRLAAAGLDVTFRHARTGGLCPATLRHLNRWLMATVCGVRV